MIALYVRDAALVASGRILAEELQLPLIDRPDLDSTEYPQLLELSEQGLALLETGPGRPGPVRVDFLSGAVDHRRRYGGGQGQQIAKACGVQAGIKPRIADLTAGLGRDGFVLASLGCQVRMVERVPVVHALLRDGLLRARQSYDPELLQILGRIQLSLGESAAWARENAGWADVIYLDPMFPHSKKSAQVKKEMLAFRSLVGADLDTADLLDAALKSALCRVVVKRPRKAPIIDGPKPSYALEGKSGRFDIYALKKIEARD